MLRMLLIEYYCLFIHKHAIKEKTDVNPSAGEKQQKTIGNRKLRDFSAESASRLFCIKLQRVGRFQKSSADDWNLGVSHVRTCSFFIEGPGLYARDPYC